MKKLKIYVETSVWGMLVNDEPEIWREAADNFFANADDYEFYISPIVFEEINSAHESIRTILLNTLVKISPETLPEDPDIKNLIDEYIIRGAFTEKQKFDAAHVAYASFHNVDVLVSFNYRHILKYTAKNLVESVNIALMYSTPAILSPMQI